MKKSECHPAEQIMVAEREKDKEVFDWTEGTELTAPEMDENIARGQHFKGSIGTKDYGDGNGPQKVGLHNRDWLDDPEH